MKKVWGILLKNKAIISILLISALLRLMTVSNLLAFTPDEGYQAYFAQTIIKNFHIIWIGMSAGGFGLYLGPFWIYIISPLLALSKGDPVILGYLAGILGLVATYLVYLLGKNIFNTRVGVIASLLYAVSPLVVYYDQKPYPSGMSLLSLLLLFALYMTRVSKKWWIIFAASYGMVFHIHLSLILTGLVGVYWAFLNRKSLTKQIILLSILAFTIVVSPLIAFDYFHKASNITTPIRLLSDPNKIKSGATHHIDKLFQSFGRVFYLAPFKNSSDEILYPCTKVTTSTTTKPHWILSAISLGLFVYFAFKKTTWKDQNKRLLLLFSLSFLVPFTLLPIINPVEYYLVGFFPLFFLMIAILIDSLKPKVRTIVYLLILIFNLYGIFSVFTAKSEFGLKTKERLILKVMDKIGSEPYDLDETGDCHRYEAWRYLFSVYGRAPEQSSEDPIYGWLYPNELSNRKIKYSVLMKETRSSAAFDQSYKYVLQEEGFSAYIYERQ